MVGAFSLGALALLGLPPSELLPVFRPTQEEETIPAFAVQPNGSDSSANSEAEPENNDAVYIPAQEDEDTPPASPFNVFSFYIPENSQLYAPFQAQNPDLNPDQVVWMVNAHLHLPFFGNIIVNNNPNPLLVNTFYRLPDGFVPHELVPVNNANDHLLATPETVEAFRNFRTTARANDLDLTAISAYRTATRQAELWANQNYQDGAVARPHHSEHQTGRALDLWGPGGLLDASGPTQTGRWVADNAHLHGFIVRYRADTTHITGYIYEPWHITYVGLEISMYMHENGILSLEEFVGRNPDRVSL